MKKLFICFLLFSATIFPQTIDETHYDLADDIIRLALTEQTGYNWLVELCKIPPGLGGSKEYMQNVNWAVNKFKEIGCDSVWFQPVIVPNWDKGEIQSAKIVESENYEGKQLYVSALYPSIGTGDTSIIAEVIEIKSYEELKEKKDLVKGKIVFFNRPFNNSLVNTFDGYGGAVDQRVNGAVETAKYGGIGTIVRSVTSKYDNNPHVGMMRYNDTIPKVPSVAIGLIDADFLSNALKEEPNLKIELKLSCQILPDIESYNVIGEIYGNEKKDEIIVVGGHLDAWDNSQAAHDDRAPCIQTMEVLNIFKKLNIKPKRTIRCVLFTNEETGIQGARYYGEKALQEKKNHYAAIESDRGAFTPRGFNVQTDSLTLIKLQDWLPILNKALIDWIKPGGAGGDVAQIKNTKALFGYVPDCQRYMDLHHSANDKFEEVHPREMELGAAAITILTLLLSECEL